MDFRTAVRTCLSKYATFAGRARRSEFWWFALFVFAGNFLLGVIDAAIFPGEIRVFAPVFSLAMLLPSIAVSVRRMHDIGRTGWWVLLHLIPVIGLLVMLYFYVQRSEAGANDYGPPPR